MRTMRTNRSQKENQDSSTVQFPTEDCYLDFVPYSETDNVQTRGKKDRKDKNASSRASESSASVGHSFIIENSVQSQGGSEFQESEYGHFVFPRRNENYSSFHGHLDPSDTAQADVADNLNAWQRNLYFAGLGSHNCQEPTNMDQMFYYADSNSLGCRSSDVTPAPVIWQSENVGDSVPIFQGPSYTKGTGQVWRVPYYQAGSGADPSGELHVPFLRVRSPQMQYNSMELGWSSSSSSSGSSSGSNQTDPSALSLDETTDDATGQTASLNSENSFGNISSWTHSSQSTTIVDQQSGNAVFSGTSFELPIQSSEAFPPTEEDHEDLEAEQARTHRLYRDPELNEDGRYHCPFEEEQACGHQPTKLKCNYDKYVDSHLKPHRCKARECSELRFSSTACRLRHEREAHGSHGHGKKPFLCIYPDCERSKPGQGFPRAWNCNDHMRRVHGYEGSPGSVDNASPELRAITPPEPAAAKATVPLKKRTMKGTAQPKKDKRAKLGVSESNEDAALQFLSEESYEDAKTQLNDDWLKQISLVHSHIHRIRGPLDIKEMKLLQEETVMLISKAERCEQLRKLRREKVENSSKPQS